jgi:ABC-type Na+ efflux pump permease subunit
MKEYIRTHFVSISTFFFAVAIAAGAGHFIGTMMHSQATEQRQEIGVLMQTSDEGAGGIGPDRPAHRWILSHDR